MEDLRARARIKVRKPAMDVFNAFVDANTMSKFWFTRRDHGLKEGEPSTWYIGSGPDAFSFEVSVIELRPPRRIVIEWENGGAATRVVWSMTETNDGDTILAIEETGFTGTPEGMVARALDSTGGFNQVVVAAKAAIEHGIALNVVADHA